MLICAQERVGKEIVEPVFTPLHEPVRSSAGSKYCASDNLLAVFVAELFAVLHPATLPMLERMFEDVRQDAETDGELEMKWRAEIGLAAARIALREQAALES